MALRIFYFGTILFAVALVFLMMQVPYTKDFFKDDIDIATMEMRDITDYQVDINGTNAIYQADSGIRYSSHDEFENFRGKMIDSDRNHSMRSNVAISKGDELIFKGKATYLSSDDINYISEEIIYNTKDKTATSKVPFFLRQNENNVTGDSLVYDLKFKQTYATGVHAWYFYED
ncbi:hypothetical protein [Campylobacter corcagiensis]|uniref:LPS export ABC transporter periplasmic protein LptC n=1 Tax=Campylobacter corcagiensis TaxID=1448857 RepID=A0A7M1LFI3_9BACT|nr:hypothetical protein [Campylobacter corcagiensis]QKF64456.1 lipooligosaccharide transport system, periplasmic component LptC [Campylobacter corcagiensis]QOQ87359.1 LPS export ABC transporter periplasmic protein LptC [Campylobacter corcagiensis]